MEEAHTAAWNEPAGTAGPRGSGPAHGSTAARGFSPSRGATPARGASPARGFSPARGAGQAGGASAARAAGPDHRAGSGTSPEAGFPRGGTRDRIQSVALELFAEQGYEKTSLREIAERLGVTKAALYYHFRSKEDIVAGLVHDYFGRIDALVAWGRDQPRTPAVRGELLARYFQIVAEGSQVFRVFQQNQAAIGSLADAKHRSELFRERLDALVGLLTEPDAPLAAQLRAAVALTSVSFGCMFYADRAGSTGELRDIVLGIATELTGAQLS